MQKGHCAEGCAEGLSAKRLLHGGVRRVGAWRRCVEGVCRGVHGVGAWRRCAEGVRGGSECKKVSAAQRGARRV